MKQKQIISDCYMHWLSFNRQLFNPTMIKHRRFDGHIATAKNCGTHWIKFMLSHVIAQIYDLPAPEHIGDDKIVGHPKNPPIYDHIPKLAVTHSHPHYMMRCASLHDYFQWPRYAFLVRNPKAILVSIYEKSKGEHIDKKFGKDNVTFSEYLKCDIQKDNRLENLWGIIRYFNAWGCVYKNCEKNVLLIQYEEIEKNTEHVLKQLCNHFGLENITSDILRTAIQRSSRQEMRQKLNASEDQYQRSVNIQKNNFEDWFSEDDNHYYHDICKRYLHYDFGYLEQ